MDEQETIVDVVATRAPAFRGCSTWGASIASVVILAVTGVGVWLERAYLPLVGVVAIAGVVILIITGVAWAVISTIRHATRADFYPIEESGAYLRNALGEVIPLAPMIAAPAKVNKQASKVEITPAIPSLFDLIEAGDIAPGNLEMVMGYAKVQLAKGILQLVIGPWPGTHAVAGRGRSGKTRRVIAEIVQALIAGAHVIVCDPHFTKPDSLARSLEPLEKYLTVARGEEEIVAVSQDFLREMEARVDDPARPCPPRLIVYDEWSRLMDEHNPKMPEGGRDLLIDVAKNCSIQYAGYLGFCCVIGQIWTNDACGGTEVRRSVQSVFVHQLSAEYAAFFFKPAKWRNRAEELKRRECIYRDTDGQVMEVVTIGVPDDTASRAAAYLASIGMQAIEGPGAAPRLPEYQEQSRAMIAAPDPLPASNGTDRHPSEVIYLPEVQNSRGGTEAEAGSLTGDLRKVYNACQQLQQEQRRVSSRNIEALTSIDKDKANALMNKLAELGYITRNEKTLSV